MVYNSSTTRVSAPEGEIEKPGGTPPPMSTWQQQCRKGQKNTGSAICQRTNKIRPVHTYSSNARGPLLSRLSLPNPYFSARFPIFAVRPKSARRCMISAFRWSNTAVEHGRSTVKPLHPSASLRPPAPYRQPSCRRHRIRNSRPKGIRHHGNRTDRASSCDARREPRARQPPS